MAGSILLIDDDRVELGSLGKYLERRKLETFPALTGREGMEIYEVQLPDVVLLDLYLPDVSGLELLEHLQARGATVVILTGHGDISTAVEAVKSGAESFLAKPVDLEHMGAVVDRALEKARLKRIQQYRREDGQDDHSPLAALGGSTEMRRLAARIERLAQAERTTVLLLGESGTGKGWLAERIHLLSPRGREAFVEMNCAILAGTSLESELFGHERGAFTGARMKNRGLLEIADGGTIFLDEVGDLDPSVQPKLLKLLESRSFRRIGGTREIEVDVRLVTATNRDLESAVEAGRFRDDLFHRLNAIPIELPPLRKRSREDVADLARRIFADLHCEFPRGPERLSAEALDLLLRCDWPLNVREMRNVLERARITAGSVEALLPEHLPPEIRRGGAARVDVALPSLKELERLHIERALVHCDGNRTRTAELLGISRATLHNKIKKYGLETVGLETVELQAG